MTGAEPNNKLSRNHDVASEAGPAAAARFAYLDLAPEHYGCSPSVVTGSRKVNTLPSLG